MMRTDIINLENIPSNEELSSLLGDILYEYYVDICKNIETKLFPVIERWSHGSRRGKYYHGYLVEKPSIDVDLFIISEAGLKQVTCDFHFSKRTFTKILNQKQCFSANGQQEIESSMKVYEMYPSGFYLEFRLKNDKELFEDILRVIDILGNRTKGRHKISKS